MKTKHITMTNRNYLGLLVCIFSFIECLFILQQTTILKLATYYPLLTGGHLAMNYSTLFFKCLSIWLYLHTQQIKLTLKPPKKNNKWNYNCKNPKVHSQAKRKANLETKQKQNGKKKKKVGQLSLHMKLDPCDS